MGKTGIRVTAVVGVARRPLRVAHPPPAGRLSTAVRRQGRCASSNNQRPNKPYPSAETLFLIMNILSMV